ncbi:protease complex subunit PrcB family protein [Marinobacter sp.]|uniref:protease complex subunit PrcB family protein n=1 Tax=Marinobacter sp. TaxID=50741 RepID=UPI00384BA11D
MMKKLRKSLQIASVLALALSLSACASNDPVEEKVLPDGGVARQLTASNHCGLTAPGLVHLSGPGELATFQDGSAQHLSLAAAEKLDFEREHLLIVSLGQKSTGGYGVTLASSNLRDDVLRIKVEVRTPPEDSMVTQALTTPCAVLAVTATGWEKLHVSGEGLPEMVRNR